MADTPHSSDKVAIVGGGPAGLAVGRALAQLGIPFDIFEKHSNVGGIWDRDNPGSPMYRSAHFISSKTLSGHEGFPMPDDYPDYPSNKQILNYIRSFTEQYSLLPHIQFNTLVEQARETDGLWQIDINQQGEKKSFEYRWLVCANGTNWHQNRPSITGEDDFSGEIIHSVNYQQGDSLKGKKVLVIGAGNSGIDIACDAAYCADEAFISMRRGYHFLPKHIFGQPVDVFGNQSAWLPIWLQQFTFGLLLRLLNGDLTRLGLKRPDHKVLASHPIVNSQLLHYLQHGDIKAKTDVDYVSGHTVYFKDGSQESIDLIIQATGYHWKIPYLSDDMFEWKNNRPNTFLKIFNPRKPTLFLNGFIETNGGAYKLFDEMALLIASTVVAQQQQPEQAEKIQQFISGDEPDLSGKVRYLDSDRHTGYTNSDAYRRGMKVMRNACCFPEPEEFFGKKTG